VYTRVSRAGRRSESELLSHDLQENRIRHYADVHDLKLALGRFEDTDASGGKMRREGLDEALAGVRAGIWGGIIVARMTRFARTLEGGLYIIRQINKAGGDFVACDAHFDTTTAMGRAWLQMCLIFAELELETVKEYSAEVRRGKILLDGAYIAGAPPAGYDWLPVGKRSDGRSINGGLVPNQHAEAVRSAFKLRAAGGSYREVAALLTREQVPTRSGRPWSLRATAKLLANPAYLGTIRNGGVRKIDEYGDAYETPIIERSDAHQHLVDGATWEIVNARRETRPRRENKEPALLGGLLVCAGCGHRMVRDFVSRGGKRTPFYRCRNDGACSDRASITHARIEPWVRGRALSHLPSLEQRAAPEQDDEVALASPPEVDENPRPTYLNVRPATADELAQGIAGSGVETSAACAATVDLPCISDAQSAPINTKAVVEAFDRMTVSDQRKILGAILERVLVRRGAGPISERAQIEYREFDEARYRLAITCPTSAAAELVRQH
jgi:DNA invertase Pin-like site-specific DNA recombinase